MPPVTSTTRPFLPAPVMVHLHYPDGAYSGPKAAVRPRLKPAKPNRLPTAMAISPRLNSYERPSAACASERRDAAPTRRWARSVSASSPTPSAGRLGAVGEANREAHAGL